MHGGANIYCSSRARIGSRSTAWWAYTRLVADIILTAYPAGEGITGNAAAAGCCTPSAEVGQFRSDGVLVGKGICTRGGDYPCAVIAGWGRPGYATSRGGISESGGSNERDRASIAIGEYDSGASCPYFRNIG